MMDSPKQMLKHIASYPNLCWSTIGILLERSQAIDIMLGSSMDLPKWPILKSII